MYLCQLDSTNLGHYVKDILDYIGGYIVRGILNKIVCPECFHLLIKNNLDYEYGHSNFTSISKGKLINISNVFIDYEVGAAKLFFGRDLLKIYFTVEDRFL